MGQAGFALEQVEGPGQGAYPEFGFRRGFELLCDLHFDIGQFLLQPLPHGQLVQHCQCVVGTLTQKSLREIVAMEEVTKPIIAEFMMADKGLFKAGDKLLEHPVIGPLMDYPQGSYKFVMMYQGKREEMAQLEAVAGSFDQVSYQEVPPETFKILLDLRKAATGKSPGRVAVPGFEDIYVQDPRDLGRVLKAIYSTTEGSLPGRPIGHQYTGGWSSTTAPWRP